MAYRVYVTDVLQLLTMNTATHASGNYVKRRFYDIITPQKVETRTGDEIKAHMKNVLGRLAVNNEPI